MHFLSPFPIGDIIYRLPRLSKYFKVIIELVAEGVSAHKLDRSLFAPLEKEELRKFKRNRMLLEFEGEGFFPKGTGYKVMVRPILSILNQYGEKNASCSEEEIEENQNGIDIYFYVLYNKQVKHLCFM